MLDKMHWMNTNHIILHTVYIINVNVISFYSDETDSIHMSQRAYLWVDQEETQKGRDIQILLGKSKHADK